MLHCDDNFSGVPLNYFEDDFAIGRFWGMIETRPYCRALNQVVFAYDSLNTPLARKEAILLCMRLFRYNRSDNMGMRDVVVDIMLRAHLYQEAYDFIKWHIMGWDGHYDWGNTSLPFLSYRYEDCSAPIPFHFSTGHASVNHLLGLVVIKFHVYEYLLQRKQLMTTLLLGTHTRVGKDSRLQKIAGCPALLRSILDYTLGHHLSHCHEVRSIEGIQTQLYDLFERIKKANSIVLPALLNPQKLMSLPAPQYISMGSPSEAHSALQQALLTWKGYPSLMAFLKDYLMNVTKQGVNYEIDRSKSHGMW